MADVIVMCEPCPTRAGGPFLHSVTNTDPRCERRHERDGSNPSR
jgi:hypothetical protein